MKTLKHRFVMFIVLLVMVIASACSTEKTSGDENGSNADSIKIGVLASRTGALESYGEQTVRGFELGLDYATEGTTDRCWTKN